MMKKLVFATALALSGMVGTAHAEFISELQAAAAGTGENAASAKAILRSLSEDQIERLETAELQYKIARSNGSEKGMQAAKSKADRYLRDYIKQAAAGNTTGLAALQNAFATGGLGVAGATTLAAATVGGLAALFGRGGGNSGSSNSTSSTSSTSGTN